MTIIAWDGKMLAADKQSTSSGLRSTVTKIRRAQSGALIGWTGTQDAGILMADWYEAGAILEKLPKSQADKEDWSALIVIDGGRVLRYEQWGVPFVIEDAFIAFGSGRDYAMGAMARGATAREAVAIACRFDNGCGMGIDTLEP